MKVLLKFLLGIAIVAIIINGCKKTAVFDEQGNLLPSSDFSAANIKTWYYKTFQNSAEGKVSSTDIKVPIWKNGIYYKMSTFEVFEFPLKKNKTQVDVPSKLNEGEKKRLAESSLTRIRFIKDNMGNISVIEVNYIPDYEYLQKRNYDISNTAFGKENNDFTGRMILKKWNGDLMSKYVLKNGKVTGKIKQIINNAEKSKNVESNLENNCLPGQEEICTFESTCTVLPDGLWTNCSPWEVIPGTCFCEGTPIDVCGYMSEEECVCQQLGVCEDEGEGDPNSVTTVVNNVTNPCLNQVYNHIKNNGFKSKIGIFLQTFAGDPNINIQINESSSLDPLTLAETTWNSSTNTYDINLNLNTLTHCSQEFIANVYFHEIIHVYLKMNIDSYDFQNNSSHTEMLNNYFTDLINATMTSYPNLSQLSAFAIAWEGIALAGVNSPIDNMVRNALKQNLLNKIDAIYPGTDASMLEVLVEQHQEGGSAGTRNPTCN